MGRDERRRRGGGGHRPPRRPCHQQLRSLPGRRHLVRLAQGPGAATRRHLRDECARAAAAALAPSRQGVVDLLVRGGTGFEWTRCTGVDC